MSIPLHCESCDEKLNYYDIHDANALSLSAADVSECLVVLQTYRCVFTQVFSCSLG